LVDLTYFNVDIIFNFDKIGDEGENAIDIVRKIINFILKINTS